METLTNISKIMIFFKNHSKSNVKMFAAIAACILELRTTCLYKCKDKMGEVLGNKKTLPMSHYKAIIRFFSTRKVIKFCEGIFLMTLSQMGIEANMIIIDRTNWKIGKKNVNLLVAGVLFYNCFIPLCWIQLDKRGNSNFKERYRLMNRFKKLWKRAGKSIKDMVAVADREFIGQEWIDYMLKSEMYFVFRLRENMYFQLCELTGKKKRQLRSYAKKIEQYGVYSIKVKVNGNVYTIVMTKNLKHDRKEPYIYFISNIGNAYEVLEHYTKRWKIECCFKHLKSNGFDMEAMNLTKDVKIELMMGLVVFAYVLAVREGMLAYIQKPFRKIKYKNGKVYDEISIFRKGLEILDGIINSVVTLLKYLIKSIHYACMHPFIDMVVIKNVQ